MSPSLSLVLRRLSDGEFCSGAVLGEMLGVSRTAVWKVLQKISEMGLEVESVKGKGYRVPGGLELLSQDQIESHLGGLASDNISSLSIMLEASSTNTLAMQAAVKGHAHGTVYLAEYQHSGKGRRGRQWVSPFGHNIYLSIVWQFDRGANQLEGLSLVVGVALARVLYRLGLVDIKLKWPNDLMIDDRKIGGILLEMIGDPSGFCQVVIGVGLNVKMSSAECIDQPWTSIEQYIPASKISRNQLVSDLLSELALVLDGFAQSGFAPYVNEWNGLDAYREEAVQIIAGDQIIDGVAKGVANNGALRLFDGRQEHELYGGEVSLRALHRVRKGVSRAT